MLWFIVCELLHFAGCTCKWACNSSGNLRDWSWYISHHYLTETITYCNGIFTVRIWIIIYFVLKRLESVQHVQGNLQDAQNQMKEKLIPGKWVHRRHTHKTSVSCACRKASILYSVSQGWRWKQKNPVQKIWHSDLCFKQVADAKCMLFGLQMSWGRLYGNGASVLQMWQFAQLWIGVTIASVSALLSKRLLQFLQPCKR